MFSCYMFYMMHCLGYFEEKETIAILLSGASSNIKLGKVHPVLFIFHYFRETLRGQVGGGGGLVVLGVRTPQKQGGERGEMCNRIHAIIAFNIYV